VLEPAANALDETVTRVHVGTHSRENEERLRALFHGLGWECVNDYPRRDMERHVVRADRISGRGADVAQPPPCPTHVIVGRAGARVPSGRAG
jgi:hypothetical protein